jgi:hypothetical protein
MSNTAAGCFDICLAGGTAAALYWRELPHLDVPPREAVSPETSSTRGQPRHLGNVAPRPVPVGLVPLLASLLTRSKTSGVGTLRLFNGIRRYGDAEPVGEESYWAT